MTAIVPQNKPARPRPISAKVRAAIDAMVSGDAKTISAAAEKAGLSREHLSRELGRPHVSKLLHDKTARNLSIHAAKAGATKIDLLSSANDMVRDRSSSWLLELAGHAPQSGTGNARGGGARAGWAIDLSDEPRAGIVIHIVHPTEASAAAARAGRPEEPSRTIIDVTPNPSS